MKLDYFDETAKAILEGYEPIPAVAHTDMLVFEKEIEHPHSPPTAGVITLQFYRSGALFSKEYREDMLLYRPPSEGPAYQSFTPDGLVVSTVYSFKDSFGQIEYKNTAT